jgi:iron(III) transport system permease protein
MQNVQTTNARTAPLTDILIRPFLPDLQLPRIPLLKLISVAIIAVILLPVVYLVLRGVGAGQDGIEYVLRERTLTIVGNSLLLVVTVTFSAALLGVPFAWLTARTDLPLRRFWLIAGLLTMVIPSYLGAVTFIAVLGPKGVLQTVLEPLGVERLPSIYGFVGAWLSITLFTYPYVVLPVRAALLGVDPALEESARSLGMNRWQTFMRVVLPQLRPALAAGMLFTALYTLSDFGAVAMMRFNAFTRAIYLNYTSSFNAERAAILALVLVALTFGLLAMSRRVAASTRNYRIGTGAQRRLQTVRLGRWRIPALVFCGTLVGIGVGIPVLVMLWWLTGRTMIPTIEINTMEMVTNTIGVSFLAAVVIGLAAMPLGVLAVRSSSRLSRWLVGASYLGNVLPGIVIGLALVYFGVRYLPGLYQTIPLLIMGYMIQFLPFSVGATRSALTQVNPCCEEAARSLGCRPWQVTRRVTMPLARTGLIGGMALVFLSVMKELPTTLILAPIGFRTLSTRIWSVHNEAMFVLIGVPGLLLIAISGLSLWLILRRDHRTAG